jgi:DNA recombination protein RmuC
MDAAAVAPGRIDSSGMVCGGTISCLEAISVVVSLVIAAFLAGTVVFWLWQRGRDAARNERIRAADEQLKKMEADLVSTRAEAARLANLNAQLSTQLDAEKAAHERLTNEFKVLAADALRVNRQDFLDQARQAFTQLQQQSTGELEQRKQAIEALVKPLREALEKVDGKIAEIEKSRASAYGALGEQLKSLNAAQLQLQTEAARLSTALRSTTYAGSWGEFQLRRVVEMADMLSYCDFSEQEVAGALRADLVVRLPGGRRIVVDAKTPLESYRFAADAPDEGTRAGRLIEHAQKVRAHIDSLGAKSYWDQFQPGPEFVVLFLPGDHFLTAALQADPSLMDRALGKRVLLATPTTLIALLKAAAYGWRQEAVSKNTEEISSLGRQLYDRISIFADYLGKIGVGLESAVKGYNLAVGTFEQTLLPGARRFDELGAKGGKELSAPETVDTGIREIVKKA